MDAMEQYRRLSQPPPGPVGTRIELVSMPNDPDPVPTGSRGTVLEGSSGGQMFVEWDNGRTLILLPGVDRYRVVNDR